MNGWRWSPERNLGIWRHGMPWFRPLAASVPYLTVALLLLMLHILSGTFSLAEGTLFDLPEGEFKDFQRTDLVAAVMPVAHDIVVFFDDSRYLLDDEAAMRSLHNDLASRLEYADKKSLLLLVDRRIPAGSLMGLVAQVRTAGVERVLVAGRRKGTAE